MLVTHSTKHQYNKGPVDRRLLHHMQETMRRLKRSIAGWRSTQSKLPEDRRSTQGVKLAVAIHAGTIQLEAYRRVVRQIVALRKPKGGAQRPPMLQRMDQATERHKRGQWPHTDKQERFAQDILSGLISVGKWLPGGESFSVDEDHISFGTRRKCWRTRTCNTVSV